MTDLASITWTRAARNEARALVRSQAGFDNWVTARPTVDRNALEKTDIVAAARALAVYDLLAQIVASHTGVSIDVADAKPAEVAEAIDVNTVWVAGPAGTGMAATVAPATVDATMAAIIDPIRQYLAPSLVDGIAASIRPLAEAAARPPQVIVQETVREVPAAPVAPAGVLPYAKVAGRSTMRKVFGLSGEQGKLAVSLWDAADALTPDPTYQVDPATMGQVVTAAEHGELVWMAGPSGSGKGTLSREFAARTGRSYVRIGFNRSTEIIDLQGQPEPVPGETHGSEMVWVDRVFVQAIRRPGTVILLDEPTIAPAGTFAWYQTILDEQQVTLPTGEVVKFAAGVVVMIADNTAGFGDESGAYAGTGPANAALVDRAARVVLVDYLPPAKEALALHKRTGLPFPAAERLAGFASMWRKEVAKQGGESRPFSYRRLVAFANATFRDKLSIADAWTVVVLNSRPQADRETIHTFYGLHFDAAAYEREMTGEAADAAPASAPVSQAAEQVTARDVFARS